MAKLKEDLKRYSELIVSGFAEDRMNLDYSIRSLIDIDRFFNENSINGRAVRGGRLSRNLGVVLFSIGAYVGNCIVKNVKGAKWVTDDKDKSGEINVSVQFPDGSIIWPVQKVMKRFKNGSEDSIYVYGFQLTKDYVKEEFDIKYWDLKEAKKSKWKFW
jgi:hypothetical protein